MIQLQFSSCSFLQAQIAKIHSYVSSRDDFGMTFRIGNLVSPDAMLKIYF